MNSAQFCFGVKEFAIVLKQCLYHLHLTQFGSAFSSADVSLKFSRSNHQIVSFEDRAKHCFKNEYFPYMLILILCFY